MMQTIIESYISNSKAKSSSKKHMKYNKIFSTYNIQYVNLKWEDIAGLDLNITEKGV